MTDLDQENQAHSNLNDKVKEEIQTVVKITEKNKRLLLTGHPDSNIKRNIMSLKTRLTVKLLTGRDFFSGY